jgi:hypothetical protein
MLNSCTLLGPTTSTNAQKNRLFVGILYQRIVIMPRMLHRFFTATRLPLGGILVLSTCLLLASCGKKEDIDAEPQASNSAQTKEAANGFADSPTAPAPGVGDKKDEQRTQEQLASSVNTMPNDAERQFIRTATAKFLVKDVYKSALAIEDLTTSLGGYVEINRISTQQIGHSSYPIGNGKQRETRRNSVEGVLHLRVPNTKVQDLLRGMAAQIEFLEERSYKAENAKLTLLRAQLDAILAQTQAKDYDQANQQSRRLSDKIEAIGAKAQALANLNEATLQRAEFLDKIAFSTITLQLTQADLVTTLEVPDAAAAMQAGKPSFWVRLQHALSAGWDVLLDTLIIVFYAWPLWLLMAVVWQGYRWMKRRQSPYRSTKAAQTQSASESV